MPYDMDLIDRALEGLPEETRKAVYLVLDNNVYIQASLTSLTPDDLESPAYDVKVNWSADQKASIALIQGLIHIGTQEFGDVWRRTLKMILLDLT